MDNAELAPRFLARFPALNRSHGLYHLPTTPAAPGEKLEGRGQTYHTPVTEEIWTRHLSGQVQLGLCPIQEDNSCRWGAIDVDNYALDLKALEATVREKKLPLIVVRTKSGGAHIYLFTSDAISAELIRGKLLELAVALGFGGSEVFPKQNRLSGPDDFGSWLNMPYSGADSTARYALHKSQPLSPTDFLKLTEKRQVSYEKLMTVEAALSPEVAEDFADGPPCLQCLAGRGKVGENRNNFLFAVATMLRKRYGESGIEYLETYNDKYVDPPLSASELGDIAKVKKDYNYRCNEEPIRPVCQRSVCVKRPFGVSNGANAADPGLATGEEPDWRTLSKLNSEPPIYFLEIGDTIGEYTSTQLMNQTRFRERTMEVINRCIPVMKKSLFETRLNIWLAALVVLEAPNDASLGGQVMNLMENYFAEHPTNTNSETLLARKPWLNAEDQSYYFSSTEVLKYFRQQGIMLTSIELYGILRKNGELRNGVMTLKGKEIPYWCIPAPKAQTEDSTPVSAFPEEM